MNLKMFFHWDWAAFILFALVIAGALHLRRAKFAYIALRGAAFIIFCWLILEPTARILSRSSENPALSVLVDVSKSMAIHDPEERLARVKQVLKSVRGELEDNFDVSYFEFAEYCSKTDFKDLMAALPAGEKTDIRGAIERSSRETKKSAPAVLLFTDGIENPESPAASSDVPIYSVLVGKKGGLKDIALKDLRGSDFAFKNRPVEFKISVINSGYQGKRAPLIIKEKKGQSWSDVQIKDVQFSEASGIQEFTFKIVPPAPGLAEYRAEIPVQDGEISKSNNTVDFKLDVGREKIRVLYLCGQPSPEYAFLRQLLKSDPSIELVSFVILRNPENVVPVPDEQLSLIPFPTNDIFVRTLADFDLLIFENFSYSRFGILPSHLENIERFVEEKGGGFVMIGGENSYSKGGYIGTAIERLLPVNLDPSQEEIVPENAGFKVMDAQNTVFDLGETPEKNEKVWADMPPLNGYHRLTRVKAGASILASGRNSGSPLISAWQKKKGRVMALGTLSTWQWALGLSERGMSQSPYTQFWRRAIRWLTASQDSKPVRIILYDSQFSAGKKYSIRLLIQPDLLKNEETPELELSVQSQGGPSQNLTLTASGKNDFRADWTPEREGEHLLKASLKVKSKRYSDVRSCEVKAIDLELDNPIPNSEILKSISSGSGGVFCELDNFNLELLKANVKNQQISNSEVREKALWNSPWLMVLLVSCLLAEWGLRRYYGEI